MNSIADLFIVLIKQNLKLRAVAATRRNMDEITSALQHRPVLFFLRPDLSIPAPLHGAPSLVPLIVLPPTVVTVAVVAASIDTLDSFSQDACCFCTRATNVNSSYRGFFFTRLDISRLRHCGLFQSLPVCSSFVIVNKLHWNCYLVDDLR